MSRPAIFARWLAGLLLGSSILLAACGGTPAPRASSSATSPTARASPPAPTQAPGPVLQPGVTYAAVPRERYLSVYRSPGGRALFRLDTRNATGDLAPLLVMRHRVTGGLTWVDLQLPLRPNGRTGWVVAADVRVVPRRQRIVVDLSHHVLRHFVDGGLRQQLTVAVGTAQTPTAVGTFFVWVKVTYDPPGAYGPLALGLSGFSPVLSRWPGQGRMAIHGTANQADLGRDVSHGCVRVYDPQLLALRNVPLGTPVVIRR